MGRSRRIPTKNDSFFKQFLANLDPERILNSGSDGTEHTWFAHCQRDLEDNRVSACIDHLMYTKTMMTSTPTEIIPDLKHQLVTDHQVIAITLKLDHGGFFYKKQKGPVQPERPLINLKDNNVNGPIFGDTMAKIYKDKNWSSASPGLEAVEETMYKIAKDIMGVQKPCTGKKPLRPKEIRDLQKLIGMYHHLTKLIRRHEVGNDLWKLYLEQQSNSDTDSVDLNGLLNNAHRDMPQQDALRNLSAIQGRVSQLRFSKRRLEKDILRQNLQEAVRKSRHKLDHWPRGIQQAMGRGGLKAEITSLQTSHPDTVTILGGGSPESPSIS